MTDLKTFLSKLHKNLNFLEERKAKYATNAPLDLLNQIDDHKKAIDLTKQAIGGELTEAEWQEAMKPLLVAMNACDGEASSSSVTISDLEGGITGSVIAGRDVNIYPPLPADKPRRPSPEAVARHRAALVNKPEYHRWADEFFIEEKSKILPLWASPYDDITGQQRQNLLQTIRSYEYLLVLGEPGIGKTVALQRMMWETAQATELVVPILVPLLSFQGDLVEEVRVALNETDELKLETPEAVRAFLRQTNCLIMFDGLNEVPGQYRELAVEAITHFMREFPRHRYVVTSRSQDELWRKLRASDAVKDAVVIQPITDQQVRHYLQAHLGKQAGQELHDRLDGSLKALSHTPLLLWLIKEASQAKEELPRNRGELFDNFVVNRLLERDVKLAPKVDPEIKKEALAHLAFKLQQARMLVCERKDAVRFLAEVKYSDDTETILAEAIAHGLLTEVKRQVRFWLMLRTSAKQAGIPCLARRRGSRLC
jgi:hypothetical protein